MATQVEILMRTEGKPNGDGQTPSGGGAKPADDKGKKEEKQLTAAVREGLKNKVKKHNEKHGDKKGK